MAGGTPGGAAGPSTGGTPGRWKVPADGNADVYLAGGALNPAPWTATNYDDSTWTVVTGGVGYDTNTAVNYLPHIGAGGNCQTAMQNVRQSIYLRRAFNVVDPVNVTKVVLKMKLDDAFIACMNGVPTVLAHKNEPAGFPAWTSGGTVTNADASAIVYENFTFPGGGSSPRPIHRRFCQKELQHQFQP